MTLEIAVQKDNEDHLAALRDLFFIPKGCIYFDGNSLGALPNAVKDHLADIVENQWGRDLIRSWNDHDWINLPKITGEKIAPLIGAAQGQVISCDSISINIFKLLSLAFEVQKGRGESSRNVVLSQADNFPTDLYMVQGMTKLLGEEKCSLVSVPPNESLVEAIDGSVAVVLLSHVSYRSGFVYDMAEITRRAHKCGALVIWDLAHSAGAIPITLDFFKVDFAVGCGYKFLNGGPGAPAFLYAAKRHQDRYDQALSGWMGHQKPFDFSADYRRAEGVSQYMCGTPSIIAMSALNAALDIFSGVEMHELREKSLSLSDFLIESVAACADLKDLTLLSPLDRERRASQVSYRHTYAYEICQALIARNIVPDFRSPDILRFGITPAYMRYEDVAVLVQTLTEILKEKTYRQREYSHRRKVT